MAMPSSPYNDSEDVPLRLVEYYDFLLAILKRAVLDLAVKDKEIRRDAEGWIKNPSVQPWSCIWVCSLLDCSYQRIVALSDIPFKDRAFLRQRFVRRADR